MGMLSNLTKSIGKSLFGEAPNTAQAQRDAEQRERGRLSLIEKKKKRESQFFTTEGEGKRRFAELSFGNEDELDELSEDRRSLRASGRFADDRLVL